MLCSLVMLSPRPHTECGATDLILLPITVIAGPPWPPLESGGRSVHHCCAVPTLTVFVYYYPSPPCLNTSIASILASFTLSGLLSPSLPSNIFHSHFMFARPMLEQGFLG